MSSGKKKGAFRSRIMNWNGIPLPSFPVWCRFRVYFQSFYSVRLSILTHVSRGNTSWKRAFYKIGNDKFLQVLMYLALITSIISRIFASNGWSTPHTRFSQRILSRFMTVAVSTPSGPFSSCSSETDTYYYGRGVKDETCSLININDAIFLSINFIIQIKNHTLATAISKRVP